jgi:hypothetical protein
MTKKDFKPTEEKPKDIKAMAFDEIDDAFKSMDKKTYFPEEKKNKV